MNARRKAAAERIGRANAQVIRAAKSRAKQRLADQPLTAVLVDEATTWAAPGPAVLDALQRLIRQAATTGSTRPTL